MNNPLHTILRIIELRVYASVCNFQKDEIWKNWKFQMWSWSIRFWANNRFILGKRLQLAKFLGRVFELNFARFRQLSKGVCQPIRTRYDEAVWKLFLDKKPHILYILADDYGFSDIGYHNVSKLNDEVYRYNRFRIWLKLRSWINWLEME